MSMPRPPVHAPHALVEALLGLRLVATAEVAAATLFLYDCILMLSMEIEYVWTKKKWMPLDILYLAQRYSPLIDVCFLPLYRQLGSNMTKSKCEPLLSVLGVFTISGGLGSELLLTLCVWTIWDRDKRLGIGIIAAALILVPIACISAGFFFASIQYAARPPFPNFKGCFITGSKPYIIWTWVSLGLWDIVCLILVSIPSIKYRKAHTRSGLRHVIYRDGLIFYIFISSSIICNVFLNALLPPTTRVVGTSFTRCLHSVFSSRALLHMREQAQEKERYLSSIIQFSPGRGLDTTRISQTQSS